MVSYTVEMSERTLEGKVALVSGATRGAGRAMALALSEAGALVYATGRSTKGNPSEIGRKETIEETADLAKSNGGKIIPVRVDHTQIEQVRSLADQINREQKGKLDIFIDDVWGGDHLLTFDKPLWECNIENNLRMINNSLESHLITTHFITPLLVKNKSGLLIEITDGVDFGYRANLSYSIVKSAIILLANYLHKELQGHNVTAFALTPGFLRSEAMLDHFGVKEENWRDAVKKEPHFIASETPAYIGRAVVSLASDPNVHHKSGKVWSTWKLSEEYDFTDIDGSRPHWGRHYKEHFGEEI